jgi:hypothetical protein
MAAVAIAASAAAYFIVSSFLTTTEVNRPSTSQINETPITTETPNTTVGASQLYHKFIGMTEQDRMHAAAQMTASEKSMILMEYTFVTIGVKENVPGTSNQSISIISTGAFAGVGGHTAEGKAKILSVNGNEYLRFEQFKVTNGPDLHVYVTTGANGLTTKDLGLLKGSEGDQNYFLGFVGSTKYDTAMIFSKPFRVEFATATLR